jgi:site-specific DNA-methyltransferase (adenine-specific)
MTPNLILGDCFEVLKTLPADSVDAIVTDPPYGLSFMGKKWDYDVPAVEVWAECLRVLKPGGHLLAFAGTRTQHRMAVRIEDAGFEIRDMIAWVYGSGFPKSLDVSKAIDKAAVAKREVVGINENSRPAKRKGGAGFDAAVGGEALGDMPITVPATPEAQQWAGWGTALKPALEPITVARKPLIGTVAANVLEHGTGALNVDGCRVGYDLEIDDTRRKPVPTSGWCLSGLPTNGSMDDSALQGRWPANFIHDGSEEVVGLFPQTTSGKPSGTRNANSNMFASGGKGVELTGFGDSGSAARFFYCAKASKKDRDEGCEGMPLQASYMVENGSKTAAAANGVRYDRTTRQRNNHPTVKPTALMRYLCRLVTPPGGTVLDPFMGSGSTGKAAMLEGFNFIGIERDAEYLEISKARINNAKSQRQS